MSENSAWLGMAALTIAVVSIDGIPVPSPASENQIEAIIGKLGEHGMTAISEWSETLIAAQASAFKANAGN